MQHTAYKRQIKGGKYKVSDLHQRHSAQADDEDDLPLSVVQHPADERTEHDRDDREERRRESGNRLRTSQILNIERECGENHQVIHKDQEIDHNDQDKVLIPQFDLLTLHVISS